VSAKDQLSAVKTVQPRELLRVKEASAQDCEGLRVLKGFLLDRTLFQCYIWLYLTKYGNIMKFVELKSKLSKNELIDVKNVTNLFGPIDRRRLYEWQKKGYIKKVTSNFYVFSDAEINDPFIRMTSNRIYTPSYIGLESALSFYGLIPEAVFQITSVTSRKTRAILTEISDFNYRSIHKRLFWGYRLNTDTPNNFFISDPEKTILDYLYLNPHLDNTDSLKELRINREMFSNSVNAETIKKYLSIFSHRRLKGTVSKLMKVLDVEF
jgi:predicted transcriptional regulator of viral defense system